MSKKLNLAIVVFVFASLMSLAHISTTRANPKPSKELQSTVISENVASDSKQQYTIDNTTSKIAFNTKVINPFTNKTIVLSAQNNQVDGYGWLDTDSKEGYLTAKIDLKDFVTPVIYQRDQILNSIDNSEIFISASLKDLNIPEGIETELIVPLSIAFNEHIQIIPFNAKITLTATKLVAVGDAKLNLANFGLNIKGTSVVDNNKKKNQKVTSSPVEVNTTFTINALRDY